MLFPANPALCKKRGQLRSIKVPDRDDVGGRWRGLQHMELADLLVRETEKLGLKVLKEEWQINQDQADLFGALDIGLTRRYEGKAFKPPPGLVLCLGVRHSNKSRHSIQVIGGGKVTVCQNGWFIGEFVLRRRHTINAKAQLPGLISEGIQNAIELLRTDMTKELRAMKRRDLSSRKEASDLLVEAGRRGVVSWSQLGKVDREWREPRHQEFKDRNGWSFYNAFTQVAKGFSARQQMETMKEARELVLSPSLN